MIGYFICIRVTFRSWSQTEMIRGISTEIWIFIITVYSIQHSSHIFELHTNISNNVSSIKWASWMRILEMNCLSDAVNFDRSLDDNSLGYLTPVEGMGV